MNMYKIFLWCDDDVMLCKVPYRKLSRVQKTMSSGPAGKEVQSLGSVSGW